MRFYDAIMVHGLTPEALTCRPLRGLKEVDLVDGRI
jgi:hypothetical protein